MTDMQIEQPRLFRLDVLLSCRIAPISAAHFRQQNQLSVTPSRYLRKPAGLYFR
jgi:hypothetical protein